MKIRVIFKGIVLLYKHKYIYFKLSALIRMLYFSFIGKYKAGKKSLVLSLLLILYIISPLDLIPDFFVRFGVLDDLSLILFVFYKLYKEVDKFIEWEYKQNIRAFLGS